MAVDVPDDVLRGIERVRETGHTNMFDRHAVAYWASALGEYKTVVWVYENRVLYHRLLTEGPVKPTSANV